MDSIGAWILATAMRHQIAEESVARGACSAREEATIGPDQASFRPVHSARRRFDSAEYDTTVSNRSLFDSHREREPCDGKVAVAPRCFVEHADPRIHRKRNLDPRDDFILAERRRVETREKFIRRNIALAPDRHRDDIRTEAHCTGR